MDPNINYKGFYDSLAGIKDKYPKHFEGREPGWLVQKVMTGSGDKKLRVDPSLPEEIKKEIYRLYEMSLG